MCFQSEQSFPVMITGVCWCVFTVTVCVSYRDCGHAAVGRVRVGCDGSAGRVGRAEDHHRRLRRRQSHHAHHFRLRRGRQRPVSTTCELTACCASLEPLSVTCLDSPPCRMALILHQSGAPHGHTHSLTSGRPQRGDGRHGAHHHSHANASVRAAFVHVLGDLVQSVGVLTAAVIIHVWVSAKKPPKNKGSQFIMLAG